eukprot:gene12494-8930_t
MGTPILKSTTAKVDLPSTPRASSSRRLLHRQQRQKTKRLGSCRRHVATRSRGQLRRGADDDVDRRDPRR